MPQLKTPILERLSGTTLWSALLLIAAAFTFAGAAHAAPADTMPIWRAQVRILTANVDDAETDSNIKVELNGANRTWLDSDQDDFERGSYQSFDLRLDGVNRLSDIDYFRLEKDGDDGWAIRSITLLVNNRVIYYQYFSSPPLWLDNSGGQSRVYFFDDYFMRQRAEWFNYVAPTRPSVIPVADMKSRMDTLVGDLATTNSDLLLRSPAVSLYTYNANTWRVHFNLEEDKQWPFPNTDDNVDLDLRVGCSNGRATFSTANVNVDAPWPSDQGGALGYFSSTEFPARLNEMMKNFTFFRCFDVSVVLSPNGDLNFNSNIIFQPPGGPILTTGFSPSGADAGNSSPLGLHVSTGDAIEAFKETAVTATVKSGLAQDAEADVTFELSPQIALSDLVIEARDAADGQEGAPRQIVGQLAKRDDGTNVVTFRDTLAAGKNTAYTVHVTFQGGERTQQITTRVEPSASAPAPKNAALYAVTSFAVDSGRVSPQGTMIHRSAGSAPDQQNEK